MTAKKTLFTVATAVAGLGLAGAAQAKSVNDVFRDIVTTDGVAGTEQTFLINDKDQSVIIDNGTLGVFDAGDIVRGTLAFESIGRFGGSVIDLGEGGYNSMFARFSVKVDSIDTTTGIVGFTYDASSGFGNNVLFEFYESTLSVGISDLAGAEAGFSDSEFTDVGTSLWSTLGLDDNGSSAYTFRINTDNVASLNIADLLSVGAGETIASTDSIALNWLTDPAGTNIVNIGTFNSGYEVTGTGSILGSDGESLASTATFQTRMIVTPVPASAWMALGTLGVLGLGYYGKRRRDAVA